MVGAQPKLAYVAELVVPRDGELIEVAVVIEYGQIAHGRVKLACRGSAEQKIVAVEIHDHTPL